MSSEKSRFYDIATMKAVDEIPSADGRKMIRPNIRHARKFGWLPSVTSINKLLKSHSLEEWKQNSVVKLCAKHPFDTFIPSSATASEDEHLDEYATYITDMLDNEVGGYADQGIAIHAALAQWISHKTESQNPELAEMCHQFDEHMLERKIKHWESEHTLANRDLGWAGTPDAWGIGDGVSILIDMKSMDIDKFEKPYESWLLQQGAYYSLIMRETSMPNVLFEQMLVHRDKPSRVRFVPMENVPEWSVAFEHLFAVWCRTNNYDPIAVKQEGEA